jgi:Pyridoxamine 5'-phosphate oxidase
MSRRDQIHMTDQEVLAFLDEERTVICATNGRDGWPHLMPLWYVVRDGAVWSWTYAKSQKVRNLERAARATIQVEAGLEYQELRGVMFKCDVQVVRDAEAVADVGRALFARQAGVAVDDLPAGVREMVAAQAPKRVALHFVERARATWDHRKLAAGVY